MKSDKMNDKMSERGERGERGGVGVYGRAQVVFWAVLMVWCGVMAVRSMALGLDVLLVVGWLIGAWASWCLWRMAREEVSG